MILERGVPEVILNWEFGRGVISEMWFWRTRPEMPLSEMRTFEPPPKMVIGRFSDLACWMAS